MTVVALPVLVFMSAVLPAAFAADAKSRDTYFDEPWFRPTVAASVSALGQLTLTQVSGSTVVKDLGQADFDFEGGGTQAAIGLAGKVSF